MVGRRANEQASKQASETVAQMVRSMSWCGFGSSTYSGRAGVKVKVGEAEPGAWFQGAESSNTTRYQQKVK